MFRVISYARVSTADQKDNASLPEQATWAKTLCPGKGWQFIDSISDDCRDETDPELRKGFSKLLNRDDYDLVLIWESYRLSRIQDIGMKAIRLLSQNKKQVYIRDVPIEPIGPKDFHWGCPHDVMCQSYYANLGFGGGLKDKVRRSDTASMGAKGNAKEGIIKSAGYGYKKIIEFKQINGKQKMTWHFEQDPVKSTIVKRIFKIYSNGGSIRSVMKTLNSEGIPSPSGHTGPEAWTQMTVKNILSNPVYIGLSRFGRKLGSKFREGMTANGKDKRVFAKKENWIVKKATNLKGFIDPKEFEAVQLKLKARAEIKNGRGIASKSLLAGLVYCWRCHKKGYYKVRRIKYKGKESTRADFICPSYIHYGTCRRHIMGAEKLEKMVMEDLVNYVKLIIASEHFGQQYINQKSNHLEEIKFHEQELKKLEKNKQELFDQWDAGKLELPFYNDAYKRLESKEATEREAIKNLGAEGVKTKSAEDRRKYLWSLFANPEKFEEEIFKMPVPLKKDLIHSAIKMVVVKNESEVLVNWRD